MVLTDIPGMGDKGKLCSGVLVSSRLVLTAGHCVCAQRKDRVREEERGIVVDGLACAPATLVKAVLYEPPTPEHGRGSRTMEYSGTVRPHPDLKVQLDAQGRVVSSTADLAVIVLDIPVKGSIPPVQLAEKEVELRETVTMASFGHDDVLGGLGGDRRFSEKRVTQVPGAGSGRVLVEQLQWHRYKGDSGGPLLRQTQQGPVLVGVSTRGLGSEPSMTSTYGYRGWLREELQRAAQAGSSSPRHFP